ncbi:MAG: hypothetical protein SV186_00710 [Candidatus Nanohaloarchaea archaeon]|nr:hypothetical protein [Candidatus Nanohaloarchaea archaeon]
MDVLRKDLLTALEELEEDDEDRAHELIEEHLARARRVQEAVARLHTELDEHVNDLKVLADRTRDQESSSVRESIDEVRQALDEDSSIDAALDELQDAFQDGS